MGMGVGGGVTLHINWTFSVGTQGESVVDFLPAYSGQQLYSYWPLWENVGMWPRSTPAGVLSPATGSDPAPPPPPHTPSHTPTPSSPADRLNVPLYQLRLRPEHTIPDRRMGTFYDIGPPALTWPHAQLSVGWPGNPLTSLHYQ